MPAKKKRKTEEDDPITKKRQKTTDEKPKPKPRPKPKTPDQLRDEYLVSFRLKVAEVLQNACPTQNIYSFFTTRVHCNTFVHCILYTKDSSKGVRSIGP